MWSKEMQKNWKTLTEAVTNLTFLTWCEDGDCLVESCIFTQTTWNTRKDEPRLDFCKTPILSKGRKTERCSPRNAYSEVSPTPFGDKWVCQRCLMELRQTEINVRLCQRGDLMGRRGTVPVKCLPLMGKDDHHGTKWTDSSLQVYTECQISLSLNH